MDLSILQEAWLWRALATGTVVAVPCALVGVFLYLRNMSLLADALAHVALPGIVIAFLATGGLALPALQLGAVVVSVASAVSISALAARGVREDAAIGIVFTVMFAIGVILLSTRARGVDLDLDCVLFGNILGVSDASLFTMAGVAVLVVAAAWVFRRWLAVSTFDSALAITLGVPVAAIHYGLVTAASVTAVSTFEAVGAVLGVAMVIVPPATAHRLTDRLPSMLLTAVAVALLAVVGGVTLSIATDTSTAGCIVLVQGAVYAATFIPDARRALTAHHPIADA